MKNFRQKLVKVKGRFAGISLTGKLALHLVIVAVLLGSQMLYLEPVEAAITMRSVGASAVTDNALTLSLTKPATVNQGDLMVAVFGKSNGNAITSVPSGWSTAVAACANSTTTVVYMYYKIAGSGETGPYAFSWSTNNTWAAGGIVAYKGVSSTGIVNAAGNCGFGSSNTALNPGNITTTSANTLVVAAYSQMTNNGAANTISPGGSTGLTSRISRQSALCFGALCSSNANAASFNTSDYIQSSAATVTGSTKNGTSTQSAAYAAVMVAFTAAPPPTISQSSYRFLSNLDSAKSEYILSNDDPTRDDHIKGIALDSANGYLYMGGNNRDWLMEKRRIDDGSLVSGFGTNGKVVESIGGSGTEAVVALVLDTADNAFYIAGFTKSGNDTEWRIEKRHTTTGALCTAAACGTAFDTDGVIAIDQSTADDEVYAMTIDTVNHHIYVGGFDSDGAGGTAQWLVGKYNTTDGSAVSAFGSGGYVMSDQTGEDKVKALAVDPSGGHLYVGGYDAVGGDHRWRIEKRKISNGNLCTAAECGTEFGTAGAYISDPTTGTDQAQAFQVDTAGNAIYVGGFDSNNNNQWRIEKLTATTGTAITEFGTSGAVTYDSPVAAGDDDRIIDIDIDDFGGFIFTAGQVENAAGNLEWRIEKRYRNSGALCTIANGCGTEFGSGGATVVNPSGNDDAPGWISVDLQRSLLYTSGGDRSNGASEQQWRIQKFDLDNGGMWLGSQNSTAIASTEVTFRLRLLLHVSNQIMYSGENIMKLQYASKNGTCDTAFVNEEYTDVITNAAAGINYHDNASLADAAGVDITGVTGSPTHSSPAHTNILQSIEEANTFTPVADAQPNVDGMWDFVMKDNNAFGAYCFRVVYSSGDALLTSNGGTYDVIPEITFCRNDPRTDNLLRHGTYFCEGTKRGFYWSRD